ncbi:MAG: iron-sulfur cluster assembly scaffold protein [Gammaproteobacteria bacterium]|nr:iron-sulfur cluster assembly scaffold protein [Gammaproteobacteria bacterium]
MAYSDSVRRWFSTPFEPLKDEASAVYSGAKAAGWAVAFEVELEAGKVMAVRAAAYGNPVVIATTSWLANSAIGVDLFHLLTSQQLAEQLAVEPNRLHSVKDVHSAFLRASQTALNVVN